MLESILQFAQQYGIWAAMYIILFVWTMRESKHREEKLMTTLDKYADSFGRLSQDVSEIKQDVDELKSK